jgi:cation/acetate symporter
MSESVMGHKAFKSQLKRYYSFYTVGFIVFLVLLAIAEQMGLSEQWIGYCFLAGTICLYAGIGVMSRTVDPAEYYVAGRRVPAFFNGMATGADWMSAASFIGMAGTLYLAGFDGLSFVMGWTGGYCLVAFLLAPYLRKFGQFTIPDFLGERYGGNIVRSVGIFAAILCSFTYCGRANLRRGTDHQPLHRARVRHRRVRRSRRHSGVLVPGRHARGHLDAGCAVHHSDHRLSDAGGLAVVKYTGNPVPQLGLRAGAAEGDRARESADQRSERDRGAQYFSKRALTQPNANPQRPCRRLHARQGRSREEACRLKARGAAPAEMASTEAALAAYPKDENAAKAQWNKDKGLAARAAPPRPHATPFPGKDEAAQNIARNNFLGIVFCMMFGTAALPHILMRYYTTPSVRQARQSVFWSLFFIFLLYFTAPSLAVLAKYDVYHFLVGSTFADLPAWAANWSKVDPSLLSITDVNKDGIVQLG